MQVEYKQEWFQKTAWKTGAEENTLNIEIKKSKGTW